MKTFKEFINEMGGGAVGGSAGPTNTAGGGNIAGIGVGPKGEPGVDMRKRKRHNPIMMSMGTRKPPK